MPKFKTPEEELSYLRAHISKREQELIQRGHLNMQKKMQQKILFLEYKEIPQGM